MRLSINLTNYSWQGDPAAQLRSVARAADEAGLDTVWVPDHLLQVDPTSGPATEMLEAYSTLGFLAAATERVRLGTMVTAATYRPPALLVKAVTTIDVLTGGRAWLGVGAGYHEAEAAAMGLDLPPRAERSARLAETVRLALAMWGEEDGPFDGAYYRLGSTACSPAPATWPHPPILIGGSGERQTLRLVAKYADACNLFDIPDGGRTLSRKLDVLERWCDHYGRPCRDIDKTISTRLQPDETPDAFVRRCGELALLGIDHVVVIASGPWNPERIAVLAAAVPMLSTVVV